MSQSNTTSLPNESFPFIPAAPSASRSPCPALNALANHGYVSRNGKCIHFWSLLSAIKRVYNLSFLLALLLTTVGYFTCGAFSPFPTLSKQQRHQCSCPLGTLAHHLPWPSWTLDLSSLCAHGPLKITHDASLVHSDEPGLASTTPNPVLLTELLTLARHSPSFDLHVSSPPSLASHPPSPHSTSHDGLTLSDLGRIHASREAKLPPHHALNPIHEQVALGECGLAWCVMRRRGSGSHSRSAERSGVIPATSLEQWFGEERLPEGWWDVGGGRPAKEVGIWEAGKRAKEVGLWCKERGQRPRYTLVLRE